MEDALAAEHKGQSVTSTVADGEHVRCERCGRWRLSMTTTCAAKRRHCATSRSHDSDQNTQPLSKCAAAPEVCGCRLTAR